MKGTPDGEPPGRSIGFPKKPEPSRRGWMPMRIPAVFTAVLFTTHSLAVAGEPSMTSPGLAAQREHLSKTLKVQDLEAVRPADSPQTAWKPYPVSLAPANWIWLPSSRTLSNTFVLFRKEIELSAPPTRATGWLTADSRYRLTVNGQRVQWGPAPCDPRHVDADPFDITALLKAGKNVIGVEVLHYGLGDGTWPAGKPGFIFNATIESPGGQKQDIVSDTSWLTLLDRAHAPGQYKRWYLRALQEEFDARLHPVGWDTADYRPDRRWLPAMVLACPSDKPSSCAHYSSNDLVDRISPAVATLRARQIPAMREERIPALRLAESGKVEWLRDPADWFDCRIPGSFNVTRAPVAQEKGPGVWEIPLGKDSLKAAFLTFEFKDHIVGWPGFTIEAPEGTVIELMVQESHAPTGPAWLDTHFYSWTRFICREGVNRFETFDYESLRWMQLHIRDASRPVVVRDVAVRRRQYDWPKAPHIVCSEPPLQRLFDATFNTLHNSAQDIVVDGMGRERQQYSGDCGHQLHAVRYAFGETRLPRRYLRTFSEGMTPQGYFLDCWPAFDRLARVLQKQIDGAYWGPILDHGIGFNFDCWNHYFETGDLEALAEPYPRLLRFATYLESTRTAEGLLPVVNLGMPTVWIDHNAYKQERHKQCAFNLYAAAMFRHALSPICRAFGDPQRADHYDGLGRQLTEATIRTFWSPERGVFVNNLPWLPEEKSLRMCDRSLATAILFDQCPDNNTAASLKALATCPPELGLSYPANAGWRYWALAKLGRIDVILREFRERWAKMPSVVHNNALQEDWGARPDTSDEWSHCPVVPVYLLFMDIAGIRPTAPGFAKIQVRPQLGDLGDIDLTAHTVRGPIHFAAKREKDGHRVTLELPAGCEGELLLPEGANPGLPVLAADPVLKLGRFKLNTGANAFDVHPAEKR